MRRSTRTRSEALHCLDQVPRKLVATSRCGGVSVKIFRNDDPDMTKHYDGNTMWRRGVMHVDLSGRLFEKGNGTRLAAVILHEFTHVVEYCNSHEFLSPATTPDNCTELAQAMEEGLGDLYNHLKGIRVTLPAQPLPKLKVRSRGRGSR